MKSSDPQSSEPWQRLPSESGRAYASFCRYRDLGPTRSLVAAYRSETGRKQAGDPSGEYTRRARQFDWVFRAAAWDDHLEQVARDEQERAVRDQAKVWEERRRQTREDEYQLGKRLMDRAREMLEFPLTVKRQRKDGPDGTVVIEIHPAKWTVQTVAQLLDVASRLCRLSAELAPKVHEAPATDWTEMMFETDGQIAAAIPPGAAPAMPADVNRKPDLGPRGAPSQDRPAPRQPPLQRPN